MENTMYEEFEPFMDLTETSDKGRLERITGGIDLLEASLIIVDSFTKAVWHYQFVKNIITDPLIDYLSKGI